MVPKKIQTQGLGRCVRGKIIAKTFVNLLERGSFHSLLQIYKGSVLIWFEILNCEKFCLVAFMSGHSNFFKPTNLLNLLFSVFCSPKHVWDQFQNKQYSGSSLPTTMFFRLLCLEFTLVPVSLYSILHVHPLSFVLKWCIDVWCLSEIKWKVKIWHIAKKSVRFKTLKGVPKQI